MSDIKKTLRARGQRYGDFAGHARISQTLKDVMRDTKGWDRLNVSQRESLEMVAHKIGRILNGDPDYDDSWVDIAGYTQLVVEQLRGEVHDVEDITRNTKPVCSNSWVELSCNAEDTEAHRDSFLLGEMRFTPHP